MRPTSSGAIAAAPPGWRSSSPRRTSGAWRRRWRAGGWRVRSGCSPTSRNRPSTGTSSFGGRSAPAPRASSTTRSHGRSVRPTWGAGTETATSRRWRSTSRARSSSPRARWTRAGRSRRIHRSRLRQHATEASRDGAAYRGRGVHEAARIGALAEAGEVLASWPTLEAEGLDGGERREVQLKGLARPIEVASVVWR